MISSTYILAGILLIITAILFKNGALNATTQTICWAVFFFFASAGASAGYLTASEVFPLEVRAQAIAVFFAIARLFGAFGSHWYGHLIGTGQNRPQPSSAPALIARASIRSRPATAATAAPLVPARCLTRASASTMTPRGCGAQGTAPKTSASAGGTRRRHRPPGRSA
jgi:hypothetical protein